MLLRLQDEEENAPFDDGEGWEDEEDEEDEDDMDDIAEPDEINIHEMHDDGLEWESDPPQFGRGAFGGLAGLQHPTRVFI